MSKTLTRLDIVDKVQSGLHISRTSAAKLVEDTLEIMSEGIVEKGVLKLASFGTFSARSKNARMGRNPKTREEFVITPRISLSFKSSNALLKRINKK